MLSSVKVPQRTHCLCLPQHEMIKLGNHAATFLTDPNYQVQAYRYLEELKSDPEGWRICSDDIVNGRFRNVNEHFFLLQVVEDFVVQNYNGTSNDSVVSQIRLLMSNWMERIASSTQPAFISNKMAHLFSLVFAADFPGRWPRFMQEIFLDQFDGFKVQFFLRTLLAIDAEVVDREISRSKDVLDRNTQIKDAMREFCVRDIAHAWLKILKVCDDGNKSLCLDAIAAFIDWIDLELVANDEMIPFIIDSVNHPPTMEAGISAISGILYKGMDGNSKVALIKAFYHAFIAKNFLDASEDYEQTRRAASLINCMGLNLIECFNKAKGNDKLLAECVEHIEALVPKSMLCFYHEDLQAAHTIADFLKGYTDLLRSVSKGSTLESKKSFLEGLAIACIRHWTFPEDLEVGGTGECEAEFLQFRKEVKSILYSIGTIDPEPVVTNIYTIASDICSRASVASARELESAVSLVFHLTDFLPVNYLRSENNKIPHMVLMVINSTLADRLISPVNLAFFEVGSRYDKIISNDNAALKHLVECFLDARGMCHSDEKVRARVVYLFCRFVKAHKSFLGAYVGNILSRLIPFLGVGSNQNSLLCPDEQSFVFESTATLIVNGELKPAEKEQYMKELASTLVNKFSVTAANIQATPATETKRRELLFAEMNNIIGYSSRITKAFSPQATMDSCNCTDAFVYMMTTFINAVTVDNADIILDSLRQYLHRMVICLDDQLIPVLPELFQKSVMVIRSVKAMSDFLILCQQIFTKYKQKVLTVGIDMASVIQLILSLLGTPVDQNDEVETRNLFYFKRGYYQFCQAVMSNKVLELISCRGADFLQIFVNSIYQGIHIPDDVQQKAALSALTKMFQNYGDNEDIMNCVWYKSLETAIRVPISATFAGSDPQHLLVQHEVTTLLQVIRAIMPERFDICIASFVQEQYLQHMREAFATLKGKELDKVMDELFSKVRSTYGLC
uniref:Exportin-T n=1 Tax=Steinernema glaseri TaxID=37863 RepID=A0A1I7Z6U6_9BILA